MLTDQTHIIGTNVVSPTGERLGDIKEVVLDPSNGKVVYFVVAFGGFFSMGNNLFAIPFAAFDFNSTTNEYVLDISKAQLNPAPGVHAKWLSASPVEWHGLAA